MLRQGGLHGEAQTGDRVARVGPLGVAAAESAVDLARVVHQERGPGQVEIEFKKVEIDASDF
jgi:hypothetical protein